MGQQGPNKQHVPAAHAPQRAEPRRPAESQAGHSSKGLGVSWRPQSCCGAGASGERSKLTRPAGRGDDPPDNPSARHASPNAQGCSEAGSWARETAIVDPDERSATHGEVPGGRDASRAKESTARGERASACASEGNTRKRVQQVIPNPLPNYKAPIWVPGRGEERRRGKRDGRPRSGRAVRSPARSPAPSWDAPARPVPHEMASSLPLTMHSKLCSCSSS